MRDTNWGDSAYRGKFQFRKKFIFIPFIAIGAFALISFIVMSLWNNLLPDIFHTSSITFWQAAGLLVLSKILFGFGGRPGRGGAPWMRHRMERFKNMSPEEQQRFREEMRERCGNWGRRRGSFNWDERTGDTSAPPEEASKSGE